MDTVEWAVAFAAVALALVLVSALRGRKSEDAFADVVAFERARRALARDVPRVVNPLVPDIEETGDVRRTA